MHTLKRCSECSKFELWQQSQAEVPESNAAECTTPGMLLIHLAMYSLALYSLASLKICSRAPRMLVRHQPRRKDDNCFQGCPTI